VIGRARYTLLALLFSFLWAAAFVAIKVALHFSPPFILMASRFLLAGAGLLACAWLCGRPWPARAAEWGPIVVLGLLNQALYLGLAAVTLQHLSAGMGAVLASTTPLTLALLAPWLLGERLTAWRLGGLGLSFAGVGWVMWSRVGDQDRPGAMALFLSTTLFFVAGTIVFKRLRAGYDLFVLNGGQLLTGGLVLCVPGLLVERLADVRLTWELALAHAFLVVAVSGGAMLIWFWLLRHGDATRASAYFFLNPVIGLFLGALFLGEPLRVSDYLGSAAVAAGIYVVQRT
jgi:drug/metabolite transporter (DMT)-like permease